ncbi:MAG: hypothetical protein CME60_03510 [Halobacteriovoraceae bacterium]|nr:hypothetical protein [Halobacteriovoraceae bacterium]
MVKRNPSNIFSDIDIFLTALAIKAPLLLILILSIKDRLIIDDETNVPKINHLVDIEKPTCVGKCLIFRYLG